MSTHAGVAASVKQRLLNKARSERLDFQLLLTRYFLERLLYRLSRSAHAESFTLKGAMLFHVWELPQTRPTRDLDLLGQGTPSTERLAGVFREICEVDIEDDGVRLDAESISAQPIAEQAAYLGVRVSVTAHLGSARLPLQIDVGFGDSIVPTPVLSEYPTLLDQPAPRIRCYRPETVVAEKTHAMLTLGIGNSRMKDFFDVDHLAGVFAFQGPELAGAIAATFARRSTSPPDRLPPLLLEDFPVDESKQAQWTAFLRRIDAGPLPLADLMKRLDGFLSPLLRAAAAGKRFDATWLPRGPWTDSTSTKP